MTDRDSVLCRHAGRAGCLTLNRPAALNALDLDVIQSLDAWLNRWRDDPDVAVVVLDGAGDRAFCAGGDITVVHDATTADPERARTLWRAEYRLDAHIARYPKPVVALMDGITMGGGLGLGAHTSVRVVTERSVLAMPEVAIGLAPDVGGLLLFARAPGELGTHLALTAGRAGPLDAVECGLADHMVASADLPNLVADLVTTELADTAEVHGFIAAKYARPVEPGPLHAQRAWIDACYAGSDVAAILRRLEGRQESAARQAASAIRAGSPTAVSVTLQAIRRAAGMTGLAECLRQDFRLTSRFLYHHDLREGIRAAVIDKDREPRWRPERLDDVSAEDVAAFFEPLTGAAGPELTLE